MPVSIGIAMVSAAYTIGATSIHALANGTAIQIKRRRAQVATGRQNKFNIVNLAIKAADRRDQNRLTRQLSARDSSEGDSRRTLGTVWDKADESVIRVRNDAVCEGKNKSRINSRDRQRRCQITRSAMRAGGRFFSLLWLMARCRRLAHPRRLLGVHVRSLPLMRKRAAQHGSRRKRLYRQDQQQQNQQESVYSGTHWVSVIKKTGPSK